VFVNRTEAMRDPTRHQYVEGIGYVAHSGAPEFAPVRAPKNCAPPAKTADGSHHMLKPPSGGKPIMMVWWAKHRAWATIHPGKGNRLCWTTDHLSKAGWEYGELVKAQ
jgi:hypothetical protein